MKKKNNFFNNQDFTIHGMNIKNNDKRKDPNSPINKKKTFGRLSQLNKDLQNLKNIPVNQNFAGHRSLERNEKQETYLSLQF